MADSDILALIHELLDEAADYHLVDEVVYYALKYMLENNTTIQEAIIAGFNEWIK